MKPGPGFFRALIVTALLLLVGSPSHAEEPRTHDGFFLRLSSGIGYGSTSFDESGDDIDLDGFGGDANLAIGGNVAPNFAIHATLFGWSVPEPEAEVGGASGSLDDSSIGLSVIGVGFTYYFVPANFYISPSVGAAVLSLEVDNVSVDSDTGFGLDVTAGKEWWVSDSWALGVAADVNYHRISEENDATLSGLGFGLRFSATYD